MPLLRCWEYLTRPPLWFPVFTAACGLLFSIALIVAVRVSSVDWDVVLRGKGVDVNVPLSLHSPSLNSCVRSYSLDPLQAKFSHLRVPSCENLKRSTGLGEHQAGINASAVLLTTSVDWTHSGHWEYIVLSKNTTVVNHLLTSERVREAVGTLLVGRTES